MENTVASKANGTVWHASVQPQFGSAASQAAVAAHGDWDNVGADSSREDRAADTPSGTCQASASPDRVTGQGRGDPKGGVMPEPAAHDMHLVGS
jgi:hypothetical protein